MFNVSDKVVCIDDAPGPGTLQGCYSYPNGFVEKGKIYVVESIEERRFLEGIHLCLFLVGKPVINLKENSGTAKKGEYMGWISDRFRKLSEIQEENKLKQINKLEIQYKYN